MFNRLLLRDETRRSRFHDYHGQRIPTDRLITNGSRALVTGLVRLTTGVLPARPWISYEGQARIAKHLTAKSRVLEFGSGMSTRWYAARAGHVLSLEDNQPWYDRTHAGLLACGNVDHRFCASLDDYLALGHVAEPGQFDLIMIDGTQRDKCLDAALPLLAKGGMLYLDNSDMNGDHVTGDIPRARAAIHAYAAANGKRVETITDFAPTQLFVAEATMLFN